MNNIPNINDDECFTGCLVRYLHRTDLNPKIIRKVGKLYGEKLILKNIKFPVKVRVIHKIERKTSIDIRVFDYKDKKKYPIKVLK